MPRADPPTPDEGTVPQVSFVIPFLDGDDYLRDAVASVFAQQGCRWELILVDDGSRDGGAAYARDLARRDPRCTYLTHPGRANRGTAASRRLGLGAARGAHVLFLDHDDLLLPGAAARMVSALEASPAAAAVFCGTLHRHVEEGRTVAEAVLGFAPYDDGIVSRFALFRDLVRSDRLHPQPGSSLFRRAALAAALDGVPPLDAAIYEDSAIVLALLVEHDVCLISEPASVYRIHGQSKSARAAAEGTYEDSPWCADRIAFLEWARRSLRLDARRAAYLAAAVASLRVLGRVAAVYRSLPGPLRAAIRRLRGAGPVR